MSIKNFLEEYPLYKKYKTDIEFFNYGLDYTRVIKPAINLVCKICNGLQTFNMTEEYLVNNYNGTSKFVIPSTQTATYQCNSCERMSTIFLLYFQQEKKGKEANVLTITKVGQNPAWSIVVEKELEDSLGVYISEYKKGLICESQGYGIAANAYYRRVVENIIDKLLEDLEDFINTENLEEYKKALEESKQNRVTEKKIEIIKNLLPKSLSIGDTNPLKILHSQLSAGIHSESDEECLESAGLIRKAIVYLVKKVISNKIHNEEFNQSIQKLSGKKKK